MKRPTDPYLILEARQNTIVVNDNGVHSTVRIQQASHATNTMPDDGEDETNTSARNAATPEDKRSSDQEQERKQKYVVERIIRHYDQRAKRSVKVRWYKYGSKGDATEPARKIIHQLIAR